MKIKINNNNIWLEFPKDNTATRLDYTYISKYAPCRIGKDKYKQPLTKTSLLNLIHHFGINPTKDFNISKILIELNIALNFQTTHYTIGNDLLRPYQLQGVDWIKQRIQSTYGLCLFWAMRTGKTRTTCVAVSNYNKIIILSLAGQEQNWIDTFKIVGRECSNLHKKSKVAREKIYSEFNNSPRAILVGSVNTLSKDILNETFLPDKHSIDCLVIDEIHKVKNTKTSLHKGVRALRNKAIYCLGLTGTPTSKHPSEVLPLISLVTDYKKPTKIETEWTNNQQMFSKTYLTEYFFVKYENDYGGMLVDALKPQKKGEWLEFISLYCSQVNKEQALQWVKEPLVQNIYLSMNKDQRKMYESCLFDLEIKLNNGDVMQIQETIAQLTRLRQIATCPNLLVDTVSNIKEEWLMEYLEAHDYSSVIIFTTHTSYLKILETKLRDKGYNLGTITGETKDKYLVANQFQNGEFDILLANIEAGSKGITLDRADTIIFLDKDWRPDENAQAVERFTATSPDRVKLNEVINLSIGDKFVDGNDIIESIDFYISKVLENKLSKTEVVNNFKKFLDKKVKTMIE